MATCPHCSREFPGDKINSRHLSKCNPSLKILTEPCLCGHQSTSATQMKRHRTGCAVWGARDRNAVHRARMEATSLERYGVKDASQLPQVQERRRATTKERYGAENVFAKDSVLFGQVQASLEGKRPVLRGAENPFARPEVQAKIRGHWQQEHGVNGPQQVPEIRAATKATNLERHGGELLASPDLRAKAEATNLARYGAAFVGGTPEVQAKVIATNMVRYGVPHTCMDPEVRRKQLEAMEARYGSHYFASDEGKAGIRAAMLEKYGVEFPGAMEGHWEKAVTAFRERYGVDHPLHVPEILQAMVKRMVATKIQKYGSPWGPVPRDGPNMFERRVGALCPEMLFTGDGKFWRWVPNLGHYKNPDFILPGPEPGHPKRGVTKVVECFGDFWHSRMFTGKANWEHEQELVAAFAAIGIECLIIWESEVKTDLEGVRTQLETFCSVVP